VYRCAAKCARIAQESDVHVHLSSVWINAKGQPDDLESIRGMRTPVDRVFALDTLGWINICSKPQHIEVWVNPRSARALSLGGAAQVLEELQKRDPSRVALLEVHDSEPKGSFPIDNPIGLFRLIDEGLSITANPGHPLEHLKATAAEAADLCNEPAKQILRYAELHSYRLTNELVQCVEASSGRAKIILASADGSVQYLCHDPRTVKYWSRRTPFVGCFLDRLPVPNPIKRSLKADSTAVFRERRTFVSVISGLHRVISPEVAGTNTYSRVLVPLTAPVAHNDELPVLVLVSALGK